MVSVVEEPESNDQAKCLVRRFPNPLDKLAVEDHFKCCVDKNKTVRQFVHIVAQYFNLEVDSFSLTFSSYKSDSTSESGEKVFIMD